MLTEDAKVRFCCEQFCELLWNIHCRSARLVIALYSWLYLKMLKLWKTLWNASRNEI